MSIWIILSWILVALLTAINIFVFIKLKKASEQMLKMAFPNAKNMTDALSQMQGMMSRMGGGMGAMGGAGRGSPFGAGGKGSDAQLKNALEMLQNMKKGRR